MAIHSKILAWKIPWTEEPGRLVHRIAKSWTRLSEHTHTHTHTHKEKTKDVSVYLWLVFWKNQMISIFIHAERI